MEYEEKISEIESLLTSLTQGKRVGQLLAESEYSEEFQPLVRSVNKLSEDLSETIRFARELTVGNLSAETPDKRVYLAGPLKEIHSQLNSISYGLQQLTSGKITARFYNSGELSHWFNKMVEREAARLKTDADGNEQWSEVNSWRYHQVLSAINRLNIMVMQVDAGGEIVFGNPAAFKLFPDRRLPYWEDLGEDAPELIRYLAGFAGLERDFLSEVSGNREFPVLKELFSQETGSWYKITSDIIPFVDGRSGMLHMIDDISTWKEHEEKLTEAATMDPLTGAYSRGAGVERLSDFISHREANPSCVIFVDIDGLKTINDLFGHQEGDNTICVIAEVLTNYSREKDWVIRYGGDEFIIVLADCSEATARGIVGRMQKRIDALNSELAGEKGYLLSFSAGIVELRGQYSDLTQILEVADERMYEAKKNKKTGKK